MTRYTITNVAPTTLTGNVERVYKVVEAAGAAGCTWTDIAATSGIVATSGIHSYLYTLRKGGWIKNEEVAATHKEKDEEECERIMRVRAFKWKCPSCGVWTSGPIGRQCILCKGGATMTPKDEVHEIPLPEKALALIDRSTMVVFTLDHEAKTARALAFGPREVWGTGRFVGGVTSEIEPFARVHERVSLSGKNLRLMSHPFNTKVVYTIISEAGVRG